VTTLDNLALLCRHHHRLKTYDGWVLARHGPSDADPRWSFTPQPPFGQEPDPGPDRIPDDERTDDERTDDQPTDDQPTRDQPTDDPPPDDRTLFDRPPEAVPRR
jgi:hypothetical protein